MDEKLRQILDAIPERPPRSKLEPHAEVIRELRRKRRTYVEIATFFREHLQLTVAPSTIHDFVKMRARKARSGATAPELPAPITAPVSDGAEIRTSTTMPPTSGDALDRIRAVRKRPVVSASETKRFEFDPQEPLTLNPKPKEK